MAASALAPRTMPGVLFARGMQRATDTRSAHPMQFHKLVRKVVADGHICMVAENAFPSIVMENLRTVKRCPRLHHQYRGEHHESVDRHDEWTAARGEHGRSRVLLVSERHVPVESIKETNSVHHILVPRVLEFITETRVAMDDVEGLYYVAQDLASEGRIEADDAYAALTEAASRLTTMPPIHLPHAFAAWH